MDQKTLFDNDQISQLREKFRLSPRYELPFILHLDRDEKREDERQFLEIAYSAVSDDKRRKWLGDLSGKGHKEAIGAWFEMMLFLWLTRVGHTIVEPDISNEKPDFVLSVGDNQIVVEATGCLIDNDARKKALWRDAFFEIITKIELPFSISVKQSRLMGPPKEKQLGDEIRNWLTGETDKPYIYEDERGNVVIFHKEYTKERPPVGLWWASTAITIDPKVLKPSLKKKASANKGVRERSYPYVIALFIEDFLFSAEEVHRAWFGNEVITVDALSGSIIKVGRDDSGLHYFRDQIRHRSVSGTLVFKLGAPAGFRGRFIEGWYVQNPYANVWLDHSVFPVISKYISKQDRMDWENG